MKALTRNWSTVVTVTVKLWQMKLALTGFIVDTVTLPQIYSFIKNSDRYAPTQLQKILS